MIKSPCSKLFFSIMYTEPWVLRRRRSLVQFSLISPSPVTSSLRSPFPGWLQNLNGPCGALAGAGAGALHVLRARAAARADMLPVDVCIDTLIAVAWETGIDEYVVTSGVAFWKRTDERVTTLFWLSSITVHSHFKPQRLYIKHTPSSTRFLVCE